MRSLPALVDIDKVSCVNVSTYENVEFKGGNFYGDPNSCAISLIFATKSAVSPDMYILSAKSDEYVIFDANL